MSSLSEGLAALQRGDLESACTLLARAVSEAPLDEKAYEGLAEALHQQGHVDAALRLVETATTLLPKAMFLHRKTIEYCQQLEDLEGGERAAERFVMAFDDLAEAWIMLGDIRAKAGRVDQALRAYQHAHARNEEDWRPWHRMGLVHEKKGDLRSACTSFNNASRIAPDNHRPLRALARCLQARGQNDEAKEAFARAVNLAELERAELSN